MRLTHVKVTLAKTAAILLDIKELQNKYVK